MKHIKIIAGVTAAAVVVGGSLAYADGHSSHAQHKNNTDQAKVVKVKNGQTTSSNGSSSTDSSSGSDSDSSKKIELVKQAVINHGFEIGPLTYNGLEVDKAMEQPGAPQNLVHDFTQVLYFTDNHTVRTTGLGMYVGESTETYTVTNQTLNVEFPGNTEYKIPYHIDHGTVVFDHWNQSFDQQNTFSFEFIPYSDAKDLIDRKPIQDGHDTSNTNSDNSNSNGSDDNNSNSTDSNSSNDNNTSNSDDNNDSNNSDADDNNNSNNDQNTDDNNSDNDNNGASNSDSSQSSSSSDDDTNNN